MKLMAINCSPRKRHNTAMLLESAMKGAEASGAEAKLIHVYDYSFKGCTSCLSCKLAKNKENVLCSMKDEISPVLEEMAVADAIVFGSPIYFGDMTSGARAVFERFAYPFFLYTKDHSSKFTGKMKTAFIYNMNIKEDMMKDRNYMHSFEFAKNYLERLFGHSEYMTVNDTMQVEDYSKYIADMFDPEAKAKSRKERFPADLQRAFELGASLVS